MVRTAVGGFHNLASIGGKTRSQKGGPRFSVPT